MHFFVVLALNTCTLDHKVKVLTAALKRWFSVMATDNLFTFLHLFATQKFTNLSFFILAVLQPFTIKHHLMLHSCYIRVIVKVSNLNNVQVKITTWKTLKYLTWQIIIWKYLKTEQIWTPHISQIYPSTKSNPDVMDMGLYFQCTIFNPYTSQAQIITRHQRKVH